MTARQLECDSFDCRTKLPDQWECSVSSHSKDGNVILRANGIMKRGVVADPFSNQLEPRSTEDGTTVGNVVIAQIHRSIGNVRVEFILRRRNSAGRNIRMLETFRTHGGQCRETTPFAQVTRQTLPICLRFAERV